VRLRTNETTRLLFVFARTRERGTTGLRGPRQLYMSAQREIPSFPFTGRMAENATGYSRVSAINRNKSLRTGRES